MRQNYEEVPFDRPGDTGKDLALESQRGSFGMENLKRNTLHDLI